MNVLPKHRDVKRTFVLGLILLSLLVLMSGLSQVGQASPRRVFLVAWNQIEKRYIEPQPSNRLVDDAIRGMFADYRDKIPEETVETLLPPKEAEPNLKRDLGSVDRAVRLLRERLGDGFDQTEAYRDAVTGMISGLILDGTRDYYSAYMRPEAARQFQEQLENRYEGVGILIEFKNDELVVVRPIEGSPAYVAGIQAGDRIVEVDGKSLDSIPVRSVSDASASIRGPRGSTVVLGIKRPGMSEILRFNLTRERLKDDRNVYREMLPETNGIGYISVRGFTEDVTANFREALAYLETQGMKGLIVDLRMNPGGLLDKAVSFAETLLPRNSLITYTQGREPRDYEEYRAKGQPLYSGPLMLLVDQYSASAAEIVAGAIKDDGRGRLVGQATFGKGSVQEVLELPDHTALKLTVAKYYTPSGRCIHGIGIEPDVAVKLVRPATEEMAIEPGRPVTDESQSGEKNGEDQANTPENKTSEEVRWRKDSQCSAAVALLEESLR